MRPSPQDPTTCQAPTPAPATVHTPHRGAVLVSRRKHRCQIIDVPPLSTCREAFVHGQALDRLYVKQAGQCSLERR